MCVSGFSYNSSYHTTDDSLTPMIRNYFKTAFRSLLRNRAFSLITILGLAGGLTCAMLIITFVVDEFSYDTFHNKKEQVYRLRYHLRDFDIGRVPPVFKGHLNEYFPEVEYSARLFSRGVSVRIDSDNGTQKRFEEPNVNFADSEIFEIFDFDLIEGELNDALQRPFTVILNEEIATKYFDGKSVVGKDITLEGDHSFLVTAVVKDFPSNSHTHFDMLVPYDNMYDLEPGNLGESIRANFKQNWMVSHSATYVRLKPDSNPEAVNNRFTDFVEEKIPENMNKGQYFEVQPLLDIHLNDDVGAQAEPPGSKTFIYIFIAVGILTLLIACINFVNLSTAKSLERAKEIGMRKVLGAYKNHLVAQFLGESFLTTILASILAVWFTVLLLPQLNALTGKELSVESLLTVEIVLGFLTVVLVTSVLAGIYPSFFVTKVSPVNSLRGATSSRPSGSLSFRKILIVVQFAISIMLIASTLIVFDQLEFLRNKPLGFSKDFLITVPVQSANFNSAFGGIDADRRQKTNAFEDEIARLPGIAGSTLSSIAPGFGMVNRNVIPEGFTALDNIISPVIAVDYDFIETYQMQVLTGRNFSKEFGSDHLNAIVINEKAVEDFNFESIENALGKNINLEGKQTKVVGVVKDFNFLSLNESMRPLIMHVSVGQFSVFSIKLRNQNIPETLSAVEAVWNDFFPEETFNHNFLDESLAQSYLAQEQFGTLIGYFAVLAIIISCMGSYGLIMFIASQKRKEVGIRKVLGASVTQVVLLLSKRFVLLVVFAILIAVPVTIVAADYWLDDFSYRVNISPMSFIIASVGTILLVLLTIGFQSFRAAIANPIQAIRIN